MARYRAAWRRPAQRRKLRRRDAGIPPIQSRPILSPAELAFFRVLNRALPARLALSLKTRLADIVHCPDALWYEPLGRRISQKHVDFTLYDPTTGKILAVIELDDRSHDSPARRRRDLFLDQILDQIGVPLLRIRCASGYRVHIIASMLTEVLTDAHSERHSLADWPSPSR